MIFEQLIPHYDYISVIKITAYYTNQHFTLMLVKPLHTYGSTFLFDTINLGQSIVLI